MALQPLPRRNQPRLSTLAGTRKFVEENAGREGLALHVVAADGLANAAEMSRLLHLHGSRNTGDWIIQNRRLLSAGAVLYDSLMEARRRIRRLARAVRHRLACAVRRRRLASPVGRRLACAVCAPRRILADAKVFDEPEVRALRVVRDRLRSTACRSAKKGARRAANRVQKIARAIKAFDASFVSWSKVRGRSQPPLSRLPLDQRRAWMRKINKTGVKIVGQANGLSSFIDMLVGQTVAFPH